jgi:Nucleotidyl transferase AbiEii toxin, Type IV TA system
VGLADPASPGARVLGSAAPGARWLSAARLSRDLDFYIPQFEQDLFDRAEVATLAALRAHGYTAEVGHRDTWLRQILVTDPASGERVVLDLGQDYRQNPPVTIAGIGPVIDLPDAAASKARALNDRRAARDYLDIHALLSRTPWTPARLFAALRDHLRPTITVEEFAADLSAAGEQDPEDYHAYGLNDADIARITATFIGWAAELRDLQPARQVGNERTAQPDQLGLDDERAASPRSSP